MTSFFDRFRAVDTDTHVTEPPDLWTSRVPRKWQDQVPRMERRGGEDLWIIAGEPAGAPGYTAMAGFDGTVPDHPKTFDECPPATYDAKARLELMDAEGMYANLLYPNTAGFGSQLFLRLDEPELQLACVQAYNDFLIDWCSADPKRLIPVMASPFWDVDAWVKEIQRCAKRGHRAVLACNQPQDWDLPTLCDKHYDPVWAAAQDCDLSISFHIGGGSMEGLMVDAAGLGMKTNFARLSSLLFMGNAWQIADLIFGGVPHRFPKLKMVSVESAVGWVTSALQAMDWQWCNGGLRDEHPEYKLLPSEYFERQIYACFWFEEAGLQETIQRFPDNILWESDYPHPTCMFPGPAVPADHPRDYIDRVFDGLSDELAKKVLETNPSKLYHLD
ncbi:MAG: amidohydrolase family protein [Deltaproteobacteria bacterium]|nr:amidohydrolase family protein [Deltaproteobacteria bacterium]